MAAHGAGLMLTPVLLEMPLDSAHAEHAHAMTSNHLPASAGTALLAVIVHTGGMLAVAGIVAIAVYEWVGLTFLRRGGSILIWCGPSPSWLPAAFSFSSR